MRQNETPWRTDEKKRESERKRKKARKAHMVPFLRRLKQRMYYERTGRWERNPKKLHWHHKDPTLKTRKLCHLTTRSMARVLQELENCVVLHEIEHLALHSKRVLRTK
jgi:hypothetical protein